MHNVLMSPDNNTSKIVFKSHGGGKEKISSAVTLRNVGSHRLVADL